MFNERLTTFRYQGVDLCRVTLNPFKQFKSNRETTDRRTRGYTVVCSCRTYEKGYQKRKTKWLTHLMSS